jgi:hypothetical protein
MIKKIKVIKKKNNSDITEKSLSVESFSSFEMLYDWDKSAIVDVLKREAHIKEDLAEEIANAVEKKVFKLETEKITTDFIRSLVDEELVLRGEEKKLLKQKLLGIPTYDLEQALFSRTHENSNVQANTPETINMYISETVLKQYALNKVFSQDVSNSHMRGEIHLHDLGLINRVYSFDGKQNFIKISNKITTEQLYVNFIDLYQIVDGSEVYNQELDAYEKFPKKWKIEDKQGFVDLIRVLKHNDNRELLKIILDDNNFIIVTEDHPCVVYKYGKKILKQARYLVENEEFLIK